MIFRKPGVNYGGAGGQASILNNAILVSGFLTAVKIAGAVKIILMASRYGASEHLDAFLVAFAIPAFFSEVIAGSLPSALVPALIRIREGADRTVMRRLHGSMTLLMLSLLAAGCIVLMTTAPFLLRVMAGGFSESNRAFAQTLLNWLAIVLPCAGLSVMWRAELIAEERFAASSAATGMVPTASVVALLFAGPGTTIWVLVAATLVGVGLELVVLAAAMWRAGIPVVPRWGGWDDSINRVLAQYLPLVGATALGGGTLLIDQSMAASLAPGSVSALNYGTKLAAVIAAVAGGGLGIAVLPAFSRMAAAGNLSGIRKLLREQARLILLTGVPVSILLIAVSGHLVPIIFRNNAFDPAAADLIAAVQRFSLAQIPVALLLVVGHRLISALNANYVLLHVAVVNLAVDVAGNLFFMRTLGVPGIALSSSIAMAVSFILVILAIRKHLVSGRMLDFNSSQSGNEI